MYIIQKEDRVRGATHTIYFCKNDAFNGKKSAKWTQVGWYSSSQRYMFFVDAPQKVWAAIMDLPDAVRDRVFIDEMQLLPLPNDDVKYGQRKIYRDTTNGVALILEYRQDISISKPWKSKDGLMRFGSIEEANAILGRDGFKPVVADNLSNTLVIAGSSMMSQVLARHPVPEEALIVEDAMIATIRAHKGSLVVIDKRPDEAQTPSDRAGALLDITIQSALSIRKHDKRSGLYSSTWNGAPLNSECSASVAHLVIEKFQTEYESSIRFLALPECIHDRATSHELITKTVHLMRHFGLPDVDVIECDRPPRSFMKRSA